MGHLLLALPHSPTTKIPDVKAGLSLSMSGAKIPPAKHATSQHLKSNVMLTSSFGEEVMAVFSQFGSRSLKQRQNWGVAKTKV